MFKPISVLCCVLCLGSASLQAAEEELNQNLPLENLGMAFQLPEEAREMESGPGKYNFMLSEQRLLTVDIKPMSTENCTVGLMETKAETEKAAKEQQQLGLLKPGHLSIDSVGGYPVLYAEMAYRTPEDIKAGKPYHPMGMYVICLEGEETYVSLQLSYYDGELLKEDKALLKAIVESLE